MISIPRIMVGDVQIGATRALPSSCEVLQTLASLKAHALHKTTRLTGHCCPFHLGLFLLMVLQP